MAAPVRSAPTLTPGQAAALPRPRSYGVRQLAAVLAAFVTFFALGYVEVTYIGDFSPERGQAFAHFSLWTAPWLLMLPWLRLVDVRPVPWFFLCMFFAMLATPVLVGRFTGRVLALPYRDWPVEYWHASGARNVPGIRAWTLVSADQAGPYRRPPAERTLQVGWAVVLITAIPVIAWESELPRPAGWAWLGTLGTLMLAGSVAYRIERRRASGQRVVSEPDQPHDREAGGQERERQQ